MPKQENSLPIRRRANKDTNPLAPRYEYFYAGRGTVVTDRRTLRRLGSVRVPPAYTDARFADDPNATLLATAIDGEGRKQSYYSARHKTSASKSKFRDMLRFGEALPRIRAHVRRLLDSADPDERALGAAIALLDRCRFRPGNTYYKKRYGSVGVTTMERKHVRFDVGGGSAEIVFPGKKQVEQKCSFRDEGAVRALREAMAPENAKKQKMPSIKMIARELQPFGVTPKQFRTWGANAEFMSARLRGLSRTEALEFAASALGNTAKVSQHNYIAPAVFRYDFKTLGMPPDVKKAALLTKSERVLLAIVREDEDGGVESVKREGPA